MSGEQLLDVAREAAAAAAPGLLRHFADGVVAVEAKSTPTDPVSEADREAEQAIRAVLRTRRPDDAIMGEEGDDLPGTTGLRWIVDPLDGTVNFLYGIPQWCVSVACEDRAGVILDPVRGEAFSAVAGGVAALGGEPLDAPARATTLERALVGTGFGYDAEVRRGQGAIVAALLPHVRDVRRAGSAALDLAWTAAGRLDAYYEFGVQAWDIAAGVLLCRAAGLEVVRLDGGDGLPPGILVAPPSFVDELASLVGATRPSS